MGLLEFKLNSSRPVYFLSPGLFVAQPTNPRVSLECPSVPGVPNPRLSLACPTPKCSWSAEPQECPTPESPGEPKVSLKCPESPSGVPNPRVSSECPTPNECPTPASPGVLECPESSWSAQPQTLPGVPNPRVSSGCPTPEHLYPERVGMVEVKLFVCVCVRAS